MTSRPRVPPPLPKTAIPVVDALHDGIVLAAADNLIVWANHAVQELLGWRPEDLIGQPVTVLVPERLRAAHLSSFARYFESGDQRIMGQPTRVPAACANGSERAVELLLSTLPLSDGGQLVVATVRDAIIRVDMERQSSLSRHLLRVFTEDAPESELADRILNALGESFGAAFAALWLPSANRRFLQATDLWHGQAQPRGAFADATEALVLGTGEGLPGRVWSQGSPAWIRDLAADANFPRRSAAIADNLHSAFAFPVRAHALTLGVIELVFSEAREPDPSSLELMSVMGPQLGAFLQHRHVEAERERIAERERLGAIALQESLLPPELPAIPGLDLGVHFQASGDLVIGGDFYDVFPIRGRSDAATTSWGVLVGDVCGTGAEAAAVTGLVRHTVRALAGIGLPPAEVLTLVNSALRERGTREDRFCTAIFGVISATAEGHVLRLANAGHPRPVVRRSSGSSATIETHGQLLGVFDTIAVFEHALEISPDDTIVFYTDGITEARADGEQFGEHRLLTALDNATGLAAEEIAGAVARAAQHYADKLSDDTVVLVVKGVGVIQS
ncbi:MAG: SpoIIE family protein phosphatase [Acidimicrobiales bacterium]